MAPIEFHYDLLYSSLNIIAIGSRDKKTMPLVVPVEEIRHTIDIILRYGTKFGALTNSATMRGVLIIMPESSIY